MNRSGKILKHPTFPLLIPHQHLKDGPLHEHHYPLTDLLPWLTLLVYPLLRQQCVLPCRLCRLRQVTLGLLLHCRNIIGGHQRRRLHLHTTSARIRQLRPNSYFMSRLLCICLTNRTLLPIILNSHHPHQMHQVTTPSSVEERSFLYIQLFSPR
jgi:hypothetical protein